LNNFFIEITGELQVWNVCTGALNLDLDSFHFPGFDVFVLQVTSSARPSLLLRLKCTACTS
jgi:hypothetical protein